MTDQPDDWLAAERERNGCATVLGTRAASSIPKCKDPSPPCDRRRNAWFRRSRSMPGLSSSSCSRCSRSCDEPRDDRRRRRQGC